MPGAVLGTEYRAVNDRGTDPALVKLALTDCETVQSAVQDMTQAGMGGKECWGATLNRKVRESITEKWPHGLPGVLLDTPTHHSLERNSRFVEDWMNFPSFTHNKYPF